jgi:hypothetical protein
VDIGLELFTKNSINVSDFENWMLQKAREMERSTSQQDDINKVITSPTVPEKKQKEGKSEEACKHCGRNNHVSNNCLHKSSACNYCKKTGHISTICRKKSQDIKDGKLAKNIKVTNSSIDIVVNSTEKVDNKENFFLVDGGSTSHIASKSNILMNLKNYEGTAQIANGDRIKITGQGEISGIGKTLLIPALNKNILSPMQLFQTGYSCTEYNANRIVFKDPQNNVIVGQADNGLHWVKFTEVNTINEDENKKIYEWHAQLGHPGATTLAKTLKGINISIDINTCKQIVANCEICCRGKSKKTNLSSDFSCFNDEKERPVKPLSYCTC